MIDIFMDSGAFSAYTHKVSIDVVKYAQFISRVKDKLTVYANLDDILDPFLTFTNQQVLENMGLKPLPVFHLGEPLSYLYKILDKSEYFALGGAALVNKKYRIDFYNQVFSLIVRKDGLVTHKVHGFGMTALNLMLEYPWYSVDSITAVRHASVGELFVPRWNTQLQDFTYSNPILLYCGINTKNPFHIHNLDKKLVKYINLYFEAEGICLEDFSFELDREGRKSFYNRVTFNVLFFQKFLHWREKNVPNSLFKIRQRIKRLF